MNKSLLLTATIALMFFTTLTYAQALGRGTNSNSVNTAEPTATSSASNTNAANTAFSADSNSSSINAQVSFFPNPFQSTLNVSIGNATQNAGSRLYIYNSAGMLLMQAVLNEMVSSYPMNNFASGVYFYRVIRRNGTFQAGKIVSKQQY